MKNINWKKYLGLFAGIAIIAIVVFKLKSNKEITQSKVYQYDKEQAINIFADTLQLENVNPAYVYSGTFESNRETKISAELQGKINEVLVDVGSYVKKGQPLVLLDNSLLKFQLQTIEVQIDGLEADVNRYSILAKADAIQGVQLEKTELGLKSAMVQKAIVLEQINKTTIKAPFDGVVTAKLTESGAFAAPGVPLLQITDILLLKFTINVSENDLSQFKINQTSSILSDAYPDIVLTGNVVMIGSKANMGSSFQVQFLVKNTSDLKIKSGMFGKVQLTNDSQEKGIVISLSSIVGSANQSQVYIIKNNTARLQNITIAKMMQNQAVVSNGLQVGDIIVTDGFINLFDGANISIKNEKK